MRTAVGGKPAGTRMCHSAGSHTAAHCDSRLDISDGIKEMNGKHRFEMLEEESIWDLTI